MTEETKSWKDLVGEPPPPDIEAMTDAERICYMIETVDPDDTEKLDEINALVMVYAGYFAPYEVSFKELHRIENRIIFDGRTGDGIFVFKDLAGREERYKIRQYTNSLDAIESLLPKQVCSAQHFEMTGWENGETNFIIVDGMDTFMSPVLPNEKLARLHAAVQYIASSRTDKGIL